MKAKLSLEDGRVIDMELTPEQTKAIEPKKKGRWRAENGEGYFYIANGSIESVTDYNNCADDGDYNIGNYYKTEEEAQFALERQKFITKVNDRIDELNGDWIFDLQNNDDKYYIYINRTSQLLYTSSIISNHGTILKPISSKEVAQTIISEFGDDLKKYIFTN